MGMLGEAIGGALSGAGDAAQKSLYSMQDQQQKVDLATITSQLDEQKQLRINEANVANQTQLHQNETDIDTKNIGVKAAAAANAQLTNAPVLAQAQSIINAQADSDKRAALSAYATDLDARAGARDEARDKHVETAASLAAAAENNFKLDQEKGVAILQKEYEAPATTPERKAAIYQSLQLRGVVKPGDYDNEKVTTEKMNPDGTTTKTESVVRRKGNGQSTSTAPTQTDGPWNNYGKNATSKPTSAAAPSGIINSAPTPSDAAPVPDPNAAPPGKEWKTTRAGRVLVDVVNPGRFNYRNNQ